MKPLKKRIQIAIGGQKRKLKASQGGSKAVARKGSGSKNDSPKMQTERDSIRRDSVSDNKIRGNSIALMDTVIRIYYEGLTDSVLNNYKKIIRSYVSRTGVTHISEIFLTDVYSEKGFTETSVKSDIGNYLMDIGISKYRVLWTKNKRLKPNDDSHWPKKLLYLELRFH